jgi:hypothetical protein
LANVIRRGPEWVSIQNRAHSVGNYLRFPDPRFAPHHPPVRIARAALLDPCHDAADLSDGLPTEGPLPPASEGRCPQVSLNVLVIYGAEGGIRTPTPEGTGS